MIETDPEVLKALIRARVRSMAGDAGMDMPPVEFTLRGGTAGMACFKRNSRACVRLRFNIALLMDNQDEVRQVVIHEWSHAEARSVHYPRKISPHGYEWQRIMRSHGAKPDRLHMMDTTEHKRKVTRWRYSCGCKRGVEITTVIHRRIQAGQKRHCLRCRQSIQYTGEQAA